jgi:hypothetical protein
MVIQKKENDMKFKGIAEIILGFWLCVSAFVGLSLSGAAINDIIVGIICLSVSFPLAKGRPRQSWIAGVLGFWLIIAGSVPFIGDDMGLYLNDIIVGLMIMAVGLMILVHGKRIGQQVKTVGNINYRNYGSE